MVTSSTWSSARQPDQPPADQRPALQVEGRARLLRHQPPQLRLRVRPPAQVVLHEVEAGSPPPARCAAPARRPPARRWCAAPRGAPRSRSSARTQRRPVQLAPQPQPPGDVVRAAQVPQLLQEPEPLLRERERQPRRRGPPARSAEAPRARRRLDAPARSPPARGGSNSSPSATSTPSTCRTREITRTASSEWPPSSKKWSRRPTRSTPSTSAQISASACLRLAHRRLVAARRVRVALRRGERPAVQLAVRRERQRLQPHVRRRHHVLRQPLAPGAPAAPPPRPPRRPRSTPPAAGRPARPRAPGPRPRARRRARAAAPRSRPARCGSRAPSPGSRCGPGTRASRPPATAPGRPCGTAARRAPRRTGRGRSAPPSAPARPR